MRRALGLLGAAALAACSYDLDALKGRDAGRRDTGPDRAVTDAGLDAGVDTGLPDIPPLTDMGPRTDVIMGTCNVPGVTTLSNTSPQSRLVEGSIAGDAGVTIPMPGEAVEGTCSDTMTGTTARVFRYTMRSDARLTVSTNTGLCAGYDTRVFVARGCDTAALARPFVCADDVQSSGRLCNRCDADAGPTVGDTCSTLVSEYRSTPFGRGDQVTVVVSGFGAARGPFRLWVGENAASLTGLPQTASERPPGFGVVERCSCVAAGQLGAAVEVNFPGAMANGPSGPLRPGGQDNQLFQSVMVTPGNYVGVSAEFGVRVAFDPSESCRTQTGLKLTFDLAVANRILTSFDVDIPTASGLLSVPFSTFAPFAISSATPAMYLIARGSRASECLQVTYVRGSENRVLLYRAP
ncbi:MAG: hypothetical protein JNK72_07400 [Myxococcales bacterium]|nr:hypothetical protein [Myxococcales bacterium]